ISGVCEPAAGTIACDPVPERGIAEVAHYLGHLDALKGQLTVGQNLGYWRRLWNGRPVDAALAEAGLGHLADLPAGVLSAGQRRRVAIARLTLAPRPLWLLDEPATSLDAP